MSEALNSCKEVRYEVLLMELRINKKLITNSEKGSDIKVSS